MCVCVCWAFTTEIEPTAEPRDCDLCREEFIDAGGCENEEELIPEGCYHCEDMAVDACMGNP